LLLNPDYVLENLLQLESAAKSQSSNA